MIGQIETLLKATRASARVSFSGNTAAIIDPNA